VATQFKPYYSRLERLFPDFWKQIVAIGYCRFLYQSPFKHIPFRLSNSYLPQLLGFEEPTEKESSRVLNRLGGQQQQRHAYLRSFISKGDYLVMDATEVTSHSKYISLARTGYNSKFQFDPQFNLLYLYDAINRMPTFYRLCPETSGKSGLLRIPYWRQD
jgi:hypothetical protein